MFKRKVYDKIKEWKDFYKGSRACLLEGARRIGKTTVAKEFAKSEYRSYILIDFANISNDMLDIFKDLSDLDMFFLRLQAQTHINLYVRESVIIFDEIQLYPKARQAIKYLVKDNRYDYIETGSLIKKRKNIKDIVIPSEEHRINMYPMDYEEFLWATGKDSDILRKIANQNAPVGDSTNNALMRSFHLYMAIGGMPQAVEAYLESNNFEYVDKVKREIIALYTDDLKKIDRSGRVSDIYNSIPTQLALHRKRFFITEATKKEKTKKDNERLYDLIDSKTVLHCHNVTKPDISLSETKEYDNFKLYLSDTGLFVSMLFNDKETGRRDIYQKLLSDKLDADLGYLYENAVAQLITCAGRTLYFHTWKKEKSTHWYEIDFLLTDGKKVIPVEVKSSSVKNHKSIEAFSDKYSSVIGDAYLFSQKDFSTKNNLKLRPLYTLPFILENFN